MWSELTSSNKPRVLLLFENGRDDRCGGNRQRLHYDLHNGRLEIPCILTLCHEEGKVIDNAKLLLMKKMNSNSKKEKIQEEKEDYR